MAEINGKDEAGFQDRKCGWASPGFVPQPCGSKVQGSVGTRLQFFKFCFFFSLFKVEPASAGHVALGGTSRDGTGSLSLSPMGLRRGMCSVTKGALGLSDKQCGEERDRGMERKLYTLGEKKYSRCV